MLVKKLNKCEELREESSGLIKIYTASIYHVAKHEYKLHLLSLISYSNSLLLSTLLFVLDFKVFSSTWTFISTFCLFLPPFTFVHMHTCVTWRRDSSSYFSNAQGLSPLDYIHQTFSTSFTSGKPASAGGKKGNEEKYSCFTQSRVETTCMYDAYFLHLW